MSHYNITITRADGSGVSTSYETDSESLDFAQDLIGYADSLDNGDLMTVDVDMF